MSKVAILFCLQACLAQLVLGLPAIYNSIAPGYWPSNQAQASSNVDVDVDVNAYAAAGGYGYGPYGLGSSNALSQAFVDVDVNAGAFANAGNYGYGALLNQGAAILPANNLALGNAGLGYVSGIGNTYNTGLVGYGGAGYGMGGGYVTGTQAVNLPEVAAQASLPVNGPYITNGFGELAAAGEVLASGSTIVTGSLPVAGSVAFSGGIPAYGVVSIAGNCGCGNIVF